MSTVNISHLGTDADVQLAEALAHGSFCVCNHACLVFLIVTDHVYRKHQSSGYRC